MHGNKHRRNNRIGPGETGLPQLLGWDQQCRPIGPQLLGRSFQKARNFTALFHLIVFLVLTTRGAEKLNFRTD